MQIVQSGVAWVIYKADWECRRLVTPDVTKSPLSGASLVLPLTEVRGFRPTAAVINQNGGERHGESDDRVHF